MANAESIVISLEPRFAEMILSGEKIYELRRRSMRLDRGTIIWLYAKRPVAAIVGYAVLSSIHRGSPTTIWKRVCSEAGISRREYRRYFLGSDKAYALELASHVRLENSMSLGEIRAVEPSFHPPQFFKRIAPDSSILEILGFT